MVSAGSSSPTRPLEKAAMLAGDALLLEMRCVLSSWRTLCSLSTERYHQCRLGIDSARRAVAKSSSRMKEATVTLHR